MEELFPGEQDFRRAIGEITRALYALGHTLADMYEIAARNGYLALFKDPVPMFYEVEK